ncbi:MAG TPA: hypothetical protein VJ179_00585 [Patescibacteria group bacterium]|nr:hypothetical protein [Patescibacteria group bacterium]
MAVAAQDKDTEIEQLKKQLVILQGFSFLNARTLSLFFLSSFLGLVAIYFIVPLFPRSGFTVTSFVLQTLLLIVIELFFCLLPFLVRELYQKKVRSLQRRIEFIENISILGAKGEPKAIRDLSPYEREWLSRGRKRYLASRTAFLVSSMLFLAASLIYILWSKYLPYSIRDKVTIVPRILLYPLIATLLWFGSNSHERVYYKDLRSPIFSVTGKMVKEVEYATAMFSQTQTESKVTIIVRGVEFTNLNNPDIDSLIEPFQKDDFVTIEYSPASKKIWSVKRD